MITNSLNVNGVVSFSVYVIVLMTVRRLDPNMGAVDTANKTESQFAKRNCFLFCQIYSIIRVCYYFIIASQTH